MGMIFQAIISAVKTAFKMVKHMFTKNEKHTKRINELRKKAENHKFIGRTSRITRKLLGTYLTSNNNLLNGLGTKLLTDVAAEEERVLKVNDQLEESRKLNHYNNDIDHSPEVDEVVHNIQDLSSMKMNESDSEYVLINKLNEVSNNTKDVISLVSIQDTSLSTALVSLNTSTNINNKLLVDNTSSINKAITDSNKSLNEVLTTSTKDVKYELDSVQEQLDNSSESIVGRIGAKADDVARKGLSGWSDTIHEVTLEATKNLVKAIAEPIFTINYFMKWLFGTFDNPIIEITKKYPHLAGLDPYGASLAGYLGDYIKMCEEVLALGDKLKPEQVEEYTKKLQLAKELINERIKASDIKGVNINDKSDSGKVSNSAAIATAKHESGNDLSVTQKTNATQNLFDNYQGYGEDTDYALKYYTAKMQGYFYVDRKKSMSDSEYNEAVKEREKSWLRNQGLSEDTDVSKWNTSVKDSDIIKLKYRYKILQTSKTPGVGTVITDDLKNLLTKDEIDHFNFILKHKDANEAEYYVTPNELVDMYNYIRYNGALDYATKANKNDPGTWTNDQDYRFKELVRSLYLNTKPKSKEEGYIYDGATAVYNLMQELVDPVYGAFSTDQDKKNAFAGYATFMEQLNAVKYGKMDPKYNATEIWKSAKDTSIITLAPKYQSVLMSENASSATQSASTNPGNVAINTQTNNVKSGAPASSGSNATTR